jgi:lipoate-protein ligase A
VRKKGVVLQHGTLPLTGDVGRLVEVLNCRSEEKRSQLKSDLRSKATTLETALGRAISFEEAAHAMADGFAQALNLNLMKGNLSRFERNRAAELRNEKYATESWVQRI